MRKFEICKGYEDKDINLPKRATKNSAGYDLQAAEDVVIPPSFGLDNLGDQISFNVHVCKPVLVKTGIKACMEGNEFVILANRSGGPIKKNLVLGNGIGVLDADYYSNTSNDGNIMFQFYNFGNDPIFIKKGDAIGQAVFQKYLTIDDDIPSTEERTGGFNSTEKK